MTDNNSAATISPTQTPPRPGYLPGTTRMPSRRLRIALSVIAVVGAGGYLVLLLTLFDVLSGAPFQVTSIMQDIAILALPIWFWIASLKSPRLREVAAVVEVALMGAIAVWGVHAIWALNGTTSQRQTYALGVGQFVTAGAAFAAIVLTVRYTVSTVRASTGLTIALSVGAVAVISGFMAVSTGLLFTGPTDGQTYNLLLPTSSQVSGYPLGFATAGSVPSNEGMGLALNGPTASASSTSAISSSKSRTWTSVYLVARKSNLQVVVRSTDPEMLRANAAFQVEGGPCTMGTQPGSVSAIPVIDSAHYREVWSPNSRELSRSRGVTSASHTLAITTAALSPASRIRLIVPASPQGSIQCFDVLDARLVAPYQAGAAQLEEECVKPLKPTHEERIALAPASFTGHCKALATKVLNNTYLVLAQGSAASSWIGDVRDCMKDADAEAGMPVRIGSDTAYLPVGMAANKGFTASQNCSEPVPGAEQSPGALSASYWPDGSSTYDNATADGLGPIVFIPAPRS